MKRAPKFRIIFAATVLLIAAIIVLAQEHRPAELPDDFARPVGRHVAPLAAAAVALYRITIRTQAF